MYSAYILKFISYSDFPAAWKFHLNNKLFSYSELIKMKTDFKYHLFCKTPPVPQWEQTLLNLLAIAASIIQLLIYSTVISIVDAIPR